MTHTFIVNEVRAMRAAGVDVRTASVRRVGSDGVLSAVDAEENARTHALLPTTAATVARAHGRAVARAPLAYVRTLARAVRLSTGGARALLWQVFYFAESMLLWEWMRGEGVRHVHVHHANVSADVALLACTYDRQLSWSITVHGPTELHDRVGHKLAVKVADASAVVCISDDVRAQIAALEPAGGLGHVHVVRCGIDVERFSRAGRPPRPDRDRVEVLCVAGMSRRKAIGVLVDGFAAARARDERLHLTLVGDGAERRALEEQVARLGLSDAVTFAGAVGQDRIAGHYERSDVFCLVSFAEGVPVVLMEAMAMELPVVATNVNGVAELVEHDRSGLLVAPGRADQVTAALARLAGDAELRARMGAAGRSRVAADYELGRAARELHTVLAPLLGG
jgi:glycosyltransferase involved in cell wall biosynthesis